MAKIVYGNIELLDNYNIDKYLSILPKVLIDDILKYRDMRDVKSRILARLILKQELSLTNQSHLLKNWKLDSNKKPFIEGWLNFNIAHSGDWVILGYGETNIGVDIERHVKFHYQETFDLLHPAEQTALALSDNIAYTFYDIWVRKEAFLKAVGLGLLFEISNVNCLQDCIHYNGLDWYLRNFVIEQSYTAYLCDNCKEESVSLKEFNLGLIG